MKCDRPICAQTLGLLGAGWFLLALFVGEMQLLRVLPPLAVPALIGALTLSILASYFFLPSFRRGLDRLSVKTYLAIHLTRFVGIYFLVLTSRGELDPRFGIPAGWGDIVVATSALILIWAPAPRRALLLWNSVGLVDILFVVSRAGTLRLADPDALDALTRLPLSFLPTLVVPLIISTHFILFYRLSRKVPKAVDAAVASPALLV